VKLFRKVAGTIADVVGLVLGIAVIVYAALELPGGAGYTALLTLAALGLVAVTFVHLAETWTTWRPHRHHLLGSASLLGGIGGLALRDLTRADDVGEAIFYGLIVLILLPFALIIFVGWLRLGSHS
jgi:hypothetical protein